MRVFRAGRKIGDGRAFLPLRNRLLIDPVALGQNPQALLTTLYRSTDCLCRRGAAVSNLSHSASLHSMENNAPSKLGIKPLGATPRERKSVEKGQGVTVRVAL